MFYFKFATPKHTYKANALQIKGLAYSYSFNVPEITNDHL